MANIFDSVCASAIIIIGEVSDIGREQMPAFKDASVEVHYRPIYLRNWFVDKKLARYISSIMLISLRPGIALSSLLTTTTF